MHEPNSERSIDEPKNQAPQSVRPIDETVEHGQNSENTNLFIAAATVIAAVIGLGAYFMLRKKK